MNKGDIQLLYEYDRWANNRILHAVSALTPEQFTRDLGSSFARPHLRHDSAYVTRCKAPQTWTGRKQAHELCFRSRIETNQFEVSAGWRQGSVFESRF